MSLDLQSSKADSVSIRTAKQKARAALKKIYQKQLRENPTKAEEFLWGSLRDSQLGVKFTPQAIVFGFIPDFWCSTIKLIIEVDGCSHDDREDYDAWRDKILSGHRISILRFTNQQVLENRTWCLEKIRHQIKILQAKRSPRKEKRNRTKPQKKRCAQCGGWAFSLGIIYLTPARKYVNMLATKTALPVLETPTEPKPQPD